MLTINAAGGGKTISNPVEATVFLSTYYKSLFTRQHSEFSLPHSFDAITMKATFFAVAVAGLAAAHEGHDEAPPAYNAPPAYDAPQPSVSLGEPKVFTATPSVSLGEPLTFTATPSVSLGEPLTFTAAHEGHDEAPPAYNAPPAYARRAKGLYCDSKRFPRRTSHLHCDAVCRIGSPKIFYRVCSNCFQHCLVLPSPRRQGRIRPLQLQVSSVPAQPAFCLSAEANIMSSPAHSYPDGQYCTLVDGCYFLRTVGPGVSASASVPVSYETKTVSEFTTFCPSPTTFVHSATTYAVTAATTIVIPCPGGCAVTKPVTTAPGTAPAPQPTLSSAVPSIPVSRNGTTSAPPATYTGAANKMLAGGAPLAAAALGAFFL
ncbi:hypothetical protein CB0940_10593 [Cercospora beticola]|uniref:Cell wall protein SED1 n=1 Tax=Cercospora beticola TaxID=122368 RepID=A0A2G5HTQ0_CERBT|nr:hypothetical protein CB0940_10593 [Cercospora beticola]PIA95908.1 hypothetical protein CB0940_10593 [Cercospora beticola]